MRRLLCRLRRSEVPVDLGISPRFCSWIPHLLADTLAVKRREGLGQNAFPFRRCVEPLREASRGTCSSRSGPLDEALTGPLLMPLLPTRSVGEKVLEDWGLKPVGGPPSVMPVFVQDRSNLPVSILVQIAMEKDKVSDCARMSHKFSRRWRLMKALTRGMRQAISRPRASPQQQPRPTSSRVG